MANNGSIDEVIGQGVLKQVEDLSKSLKDLEDQFVRTAKAASTMSSVNVGASGGGGGVKQTTQGLTELEKATAKLNKTMNEYGQDIVKFRLLQQQQAAANKNEAKETLYAAGSYKQLEAQMATMVARYKTMSAEMRGGALGKSLAADIATINTQLKGLDSGLGNMQRNVGNYAGALSKVWSGLRQIAYIVPGLGIAGIFNLALEAITPLLEKMDIFNSSAKEMRDNLNKVAKEAQENVSNEIVNVKQLYSQSTNLNLTYKQRKLAVDELQKLYPTYLGNLSDEAIMAGKAKDAYNNLTSALVNKAMFQGLQAQAQEIGKPLAPLLVELDAINEKINLMKKSTEGPSIGGYSVRGSQSADDAGKLKELEERATALRDKIKPLQLQMQRIFDVSGKYANDLTSDMDKPDTKKGKTRIELLQQRYEQELLEAKRQSADLEETETQAYFRRLKIAEKYSKDKLLESKDLTTKEKEQATNFEDQLLSLVIDGTAKRKEENKKYLQMDVEDYKLKIKLLEEEKKKQDERNAHIRDLAKTEVKLYQDAGKERYDKLIEQQKKEKEAWENLKKDIIDSVASISESIVNGIYAKRLQAIEDIDKKLTESFNNEMRFIEQSGLSQREKERKKQALEAETEAKRKKNDRDRVAELRKQAKLQKALDTAQIIANTAIAITSHMKLAPPLNLINIASDIAIGAAQLAKVVATPLPQYAKGRKGGKAEMAIVGEVGTEAIVTKDGKISFTPNKATKTFLPEGADVIPNHELIKNATLLKLSKEQNVTINKYQEALIEKFEEELTELKSIKQAILDKPVSTFNNFGGFDNYVKSNIR